MRYQLSKRQLKELGNGKRLQIAIPAPASIDPSPELCFRGLVELPEYAVIVEATEEDLMVDPSPNSGGGLDSILGRIIRETDSQPDWYCLIWCLIATVQAPGRVKSTYPVQWPGSVTLAHGRVLPNRE